MFGIDWELRLRPNGYKAIVCLFFAARREHAIPRRSQLLSPDLLQQNRLYSQTSISFNLDEPTFLAPLLPKI